MLVCKLFLITFRRCIVSQNCGFPFPRSDWLLKFVYRAASVQVGDIAGLGPISVSWQRLINIDLTDMVCDKGIWICDS